MGEDAEEEGGMSKELYDVVMFALLVILILGTYYITDRRDS